MTGASGADEGLPERSTGAPRRARLVFLCLVGLGVLIRLNNGIRFPSLHGYDSFGHVTYIFYLLKTGQVPFADQGWSFFHPPLYYAIAAAIWTALHQVEPKQVLKVLSTCFSLLGLLAAWVSWRVACRYFPRDRVAQRLAPLFVLFVPVGLYTAPMLGNEGLNVVLCSLALYALLRVLAAPDWRRALWLGVLLGLALLTKVTAAAVVAACLLSLGAWTVRTRRWRAGLGNLGVTFAVIGLICGWYYARNVAHFGTPLAMSRNYLMVEHVESALSHGDRGVWAYLSFDPGIFVDPRYMEPPIIDSVWTGTLAGTWFEVVGSSFMPSTQTDAAARWAGRLLIALGMVPTMVVFIGCAVGIVALLRRGWDDTLVAMLAATAGVLAMFVAYTHRVHVFTAVKSSYLLPAIVPFSFWFALGMRTLRRWRSLWRVVLAECAVLLAVIVPVFTYQLVFAAQLTTFYWNALGVTYYLAGFDAQAKEILEAVARGYHFYAAHENLAAIALDEGRPVDAVAALEAAKRLVHEQAFGVGRDRRALVRQDLAEYDSTEAVAYALLGQRDAALTAARAAVAGAPDIPAAHYNLAALLARDDALAEAATEAARALQLDPRFTEAAALVGIIAARRGDCDTAVARLRQAAGVRTPQRTYPWQTGTGDVLDAGLGRRRIIALCAGGLDPYAAWRACAPQAGAQALAIPWLPAARCAASAG